MKNAKDLTFGDTFEGMQFDHASVVRTVTGKRLTKTGRVALTVDGKKWSNAPCRPSSALLD
tara:strand:+ start:803 stop:985 length:183 start_codon:yes stop_codon:yes gene_type:complete